MSKKLVKAFNVLPRSPTAPSGRVPNEWHFDVRYVHLEPAPCHVLFLIQPESTFLHVERLPLGVSPRQHGLEYFPHTFKEAAPEIVKAILHIFANNTMHAMIRNPPPASAPWRLTTEFKDLADAASDELRRLGVAAPVLCNVGTSSEKTVELAHEKFCEVFSGMLMMLQLPNDIMWSIHAPYSIQFYSSSPPDPPIPGDSTPEFDSEDKQFNLMLQYTSAVRNASPPDGRPYIGLASRKKQEDALAAIEQLVKDKPEEHVKAEADAGGSEAALDYGLRLSLGLACKRDLKLSRQYLLKATASKTASDKTKAIAHGILIFQCMNATTNDDVRTRYLYAACHHAEAAAVLCKRVSPPGEASSPSVLWFMSKTIDPLKDQIPQDIFYFYKTMFRALDERNKQIAEVASSVAEKKLENPNRYRCATEGCPIEADAGRKLARCSGPCDVDKKPYYCSTECHRADWRTHRPFCRAGAPCSVVKYQPTRDEIIHRAASNKAPEGSLTIPIRRPDGSTTLFSSSTWSAAELKGMQEALQGDTQEGVTEEQMAAVRI